MIRIAHRMMQAIGSNAKENSHLRRNARKAEADFHLRSEHASSIASIQASDSNDRRVRREKTAHILPNQPSLKLLHPPRSRKRHNEIGIIPIRTDSMTCPKNKPPVEEYGGYVIYSKRSRGSGERNPFLRSIYTNPPRQHRCPGDRFKESKVLVQHAIGCTERRLSPSENQFKISHQRSDAHPQAIARQSDEFIP